MFKKMYWVVIAILNNNMHNSHSFFRDAAQYKSNAVRHLHC